MATEVWQRGPVSGVPALLQPAAHALLQAKEEVDAIMQDFPVSNLWRQPAGLAAAAFHLQHMVGVIDRLFTYASGQSLNQEQLQYLASEGKFDDSINPAVLREAFSKKIDWAVSQLKLIDEHTLPETRYVGRAKIPSTVIGLLFHCAEHTMRHVGQLMVTVKVLKTAEKDL